MDWPAVVTLDVRPAVLVEKDRPRGAVGEVAPPDPRRPSIIGIGIRY
jgi:hypothetical protein